MDTSHSLALAPIVELLQPIVTSVVIALIGVLATWVAPTINRWFHIQIDQSQIDTIRDKAQTIAGQMIAADAHNLAGQSITIENAKVLAAATSISGKLPAAMQLSGWDADRIAKLIVGEIGKLQAPPPALPAPDAKA